MSERIYVYSTLTNDQLYTKWSQPDVGQLNERLHQVFIKGGSNMSSGSFPHFITPRGVSTPISEEDFAYLMGENHDPASPNFLKDGDIDFKNHMKRGFIQVSREKVDPEVAVAKGMEFADKSAPLTPQSPEFNKPDEDAVRIAGSKSGIIDRVKGAFGIR